MSKSSKKPITPLKTNNPRIVMAYLLTAMQTQAEEMKGITKALDEQKNPTTMATYVETISPLMTDLSKQSDSFLVFFNQYRLSKNRHDSQSPILKNLEEKLQFLDNSSIGQIFLIIQDSLQSHYLYLGKLLHYLAVTDKNTDLLLAEIRFGNAVCSYKKSVAISIGATQFAAKNKIEFVATESSYPTIRQINEFIRESKKELLQVKGLIEQEKNAQLPMPATGSASIEAVNEVDDSPIDEKKEGPEKSRAAKPPVNPFSEFVATFAQDPEGAEAKISGFSQQLVELEAHFLTLQRLLFKADCYAFLASRHQCSFQQSAAYYKIALQLMEKAAEQIPATTDGMSARQLQTLDQLIQGFEISKTALDGHFAKTLALIDKQKAKLDAAMAESRERLLQFKKKQIEAGQWEKKDVPPNPITLEQKSALATLTEAKQSHVSLRERVAQVQVVSPHAAASAAPPKPILKRRYSDGDHCRFFPFILDASGAHPAVPIPITFISLTEFASHSRIPVEKCESTYAQCPSLLFLR